MIPEMKKRMQDRCYHKESMTIDGPIDGMGYRA